MIGQTIGEAIAGSLAQQSERTAYEGADATELLAAAEAGAAAGPLQKAGLLEDAMGLAGRFFEGLEIDAEILRAVGVSQSDAGGVGRSLRDAKRALELMGAPESVTNGLGEAAALYEGFSGGSLESVFNTIENE
ncbi:MAG: hypothetical protein JNM59_09230 [Hyphomonadaceae bacterium]|nr:hypothetical protein [Hyphomonadaceae bacterium]